MSVIVVAVAVCSLLLPPSGLAEVEEVERYDRRYDHFDVDQFVNNRRLLNKYLECFVERGPCTPIGTLFKRVLPEVITTACAKCTPLQKKFTKKAFDAFKTTLPASHEELKKKIDPENIYYDTFEKAIDN